MALIAEDERLLRFVLAAAVRIAVGRVDLRPRPVLGGCRSRVLRDEIERELERGSDLVLVAADARGARHRRSASWRQKRQELLSGLDARRDRVLTAIADPCVEGWMLAHPAAVKAGLEAGSGRPCESVPTVPTFRDEREAKRALGSYVRALTGGPLALAGLEYATEITREIDLLNSPEPSLQEFARELDRRCQRASPQD